MSKTYMTAQQNQGQTPKPGEPKKNDDTTKQPEKKAS